MIPFTTCFTDPIPIDLTGPHHRQAQTAGEHWSAVAIFRRGYRMPFGSFTVCSEIIVGHKSRHSQHSSSRHQRQRAAGRPPAGVCPSFARSQPRTATWAWGRAAWRSARRSAAPTDSLGRGHPWGVDAVAHLKLNLTGVAGDDATDRSQPAAVAGRLASWTAGSRGI